MSTATDAWRNRPMEVRVLELCPHCNKLEIDVKQRTIYGPWGQRFEETCCAKCVPAVSAEYGDMTIC